MMEMLVFTFLVSIVGATPGAVMGAHWILRWLDVATGPAQTAAGRWMVFRLSDFQFGLLLWGLAACLVLPNLAYAALTAPIRAVVPVASLAVWVMAAALAVYSVGEVRHLQAYVREKRWERAERLIDG